MSNIQNIRENLLVEYIFSIYKSKFAAYITPYTRFSIYKIYGEKYLSNTYFQYSSLYSPRILHRIRHFVFSRYPTFYISNISNKRYTGEFEGLKYTENIIIICFMYIAEYWGISPSEKCASFKPMR